MQVREAADDYVAGHACVHGSSISADTEKGKEFRIIADASKLMSFMLR